MSRRQVGRVGRRARTTVLFALLVGVLPGLPVAADDVCTGRGTQRVDGNGWWHIPFPRFERGPEQVTHLAVEPWSTVRNTAGPYTIPPHGQVRMWATNGSEVYLSTSGGCSWHPVTWLERGSIDPRLPPRPALPNDDLSVLGIRVAYDEAPHEESSGDGYVYVFGVDLTAGATANPIVAVLPAGEKNFVGRNTAVANGGRPLDFAVSSGDARCAWLLTTPLTVPAPDQGPDTPQLPTRQLYRSTDYGESWVQVARDTPVERLVAPAVSEEGGAGSCATVWGTTPTSILRSRDGGATFAESAPVATEVPPLFAQYYTATRPAVFPAYDGPLDPAAAELLALTPDGGVRRFDARAPLAKGPSAPERTPGRPVAAALVDVDRRGRLVVATTEGVFQRDARSNGPAGWTDISPAGATPTLLDSVRNGIFGYPGAYLVAGLTSSEILLRQWPRPDLPKGTVDDARSRPRNDRPPRDGRDVGPIDPATPPAGVTALTPGSVDLTLAPGQTAEVPFRFALPARRASVDVDFDIDTTASMDYAIDGLRTGIADIVRSFDTALLDVQVGLGDIKDYSSCGPGRDIGDSFAYRRRVKVAPPGAALTQGLKQLRADCGEDIEEAQTVGVVQAVTGTGYVGTLGEEPAIVQPDQHAEFRTGVTKVLVLITDAPANQNAESNPNGPYPTIAEAIRVLRGEGVTVVGLAVEGGRFSPRADLEALATATGGVAPAAGVDCDGDGYVDLRAGQPLVCDVAPGAEYVAPVAISATALVLAARPRTPAGFALRGDVSVVRGATGDLQALVDRSEARTLRYDATFGCGADDLGRDWVVDVDAVVSGAVVATARATVRCRPPVRILPGNPAVAPPVGPEAPSLAQAPIAHAVNPNPNVQTNTQVNSQPVNQLVSGMVVDEERAPELALADQQTRNEPSGGLLMMSALGMATAAGVATARARGSACVARVRR